MVLQKTALAEAKGFVGMFAFHIFYFLTSPSLPPSLLAEIQLAWVLCMVFNSTT